MQASKHQGGFSLIEVSIVTAIVLLIAVIGIPAINGYILENKVPKVGQELARFVLNLRVNANAAPDAPYTDIDTARLYTQAADSSVLSTGEDNKVFHGLGSPGEVELESTEAGQAFILRLKNVNHMACPSIASVLQRVAEKITVRGDKESAIVVKDSETEYSALAAGAACKKGDVNEFEFQIS